MMPGRAEARMMPDGRLHLHHGPIDLIVAAYGTLPATQRAFRLAQAHFDGLLNALVEELPLLKAPLGGKRPKVRSAVGRRMVEAVWPYRAEYATPMAAVAGAVADEVLDAMTGSGTTGLERIYVNNRGDIAFYLAEGERFSTGLIADLARPDQQTTLTLSSDSPVRGIATSGWPGRSWSLGIADAVTVFAPRAAAADAAATLIANAVDIDHPAVGRRPAHDVFEDGDLGGLPVTVSVEKLPPEAVEQALAAGAARASAVLEEGLICGAALFLKGKMRRVGLVGESPDVAT